MTAKKKDQPTTAPEAALAAEVEAAEQDLGIIVPDATTVTVAGCPVIVERLRFRQVLSLVSLLIEGVGDKMGGINLSDDQDELQAQFLGLALIAFPKMGDQFIAFLSDLVKPQRPEDAEKVRAAMQDPDLSTALDVFAVIGQQEAEDLPSLLGKARAAITKIQGLFQKPKRTTAG